MKAIVYTRYGPPDVLQLKEVAAPVPKERQVLVRIQAASVNFLDWARFVIPPLLVRLLDRRVLPSLNQILGYDLAGRVEAVGSDVTQFQPGDEVFGIGPRTFAEYVCPSEKNLALMPANVSFEAAAAVPSAGLAALQGLRDRGQIQSGQKVLLHGASGGVGGFALQLAQALGTEVTAVVSPRNVDLARSLGADRVLDYTRENFLHTGERYDLIAAANGYRSLLAYRRALRPGGTYAMLGGSLAQILEAVVLGPLLTKTGVLKVAHGRARVIPSDLVFLGELLQSGKLTPIIDQVYPLSETATAIRQVLQAHARGKVIIAV